MNKITFLLITTMVIVSLCGCNANKTHDNTTSTHSPSPIATLEPTADNGNMANDAANAVGDVAGGAANAVGDVAQGAANAVGDAARAVKNAGQDTANMAHSAR